MNISDSIKALVFLFALSYLPMKAQKKFSLEDVTPGGLSQKNFVPQDFQQLLWQGDTLLYVKDSVLYRLRPATQKQTVLFTLESLNKALKQADVVEQKQIPQIMECHASNELILNLKHHLVYYDIKNNLITKSFRWYPYWQNADYNNAKDCFAVTNGSDLWLVSSENKKKINKKSEENIVYGQAVHRNEFGIVKGTFWSPKGNYLAFYRMDESMVSDYELLDHSKNPPKSKQIKYPAAGEKSHHVTIGILSVKTGKTTYLNTGSPEDRFFTNLAWTPDEKELYVAELNRAQDSCSLVAYSVKTGQGRTLFTETSTSYVEPESPPFFINSTQFIWQSERSGHNHLYLYNTNGDLIKPLTEGVWDVLQLNGYNAKTSELIISTTKASVLERNISALSVESLEMRNLSAVGGQHTIKLSESATYFTDNYQAITTPRKIDIVNVADGKLVNLLSASNPYEGYDMPQVKYGIIKATDGVTDLHYRLTLPQPFDSTKQYPSIVHVYGGPHVQFVQNTWLGGGRGWELYMAQQGFVMFTLDSRGSANRGQAFEETIFKNIGKVPFEDQMQGVAFLKSLSYVDASRMGVYGWSFGGFMSTQLKCKAPDVFKVGVAGGSVIDWRLYEVMYGERYMQTPQKNPEGYAENDLTQYVKNLQGKFMMIHCELDPVVRIINTQRFIEAAKAAGKDVDFVCYQKHEHNVLGKERVGLFETISKYFIENL